MLITITPNPVLDKTLTVEHIVFDEMTRAAAIQEDWGGKGFNVSRALHAMGAESLAMGFVGGATGNKLQQGIENLGIKTDLVPIKGETRTNFVVTEQGSKRYIKVNEPGPALLPGEIDALFERIDQRVQAGDICALCGSLPPGTPDRFYADIIELVQKKGARTLLDTSGVPLKAGLASHPYLVKPNVDEAAALTGQALETPEGRRTAVQVILDAGSERVALSLGAEGMIFAYACDSRILMLHAVPPRVPIMNPTGAGDALLAGIMFALARDWTVGELARWAVASGTAAAMREGVSVGTYAEIYALFPRVTLSESWS